MAIIEAGSKKRGGRQKGTPNKINALLKDDILAALNAAHPEGRVGYLTQQANANPVAFLGLIGKVLPMTIAGDAAQPLTIQVLSGVPRPED